MLSKQGILLNNMLKKGTFVGLIIGGLIGLLIASFSYIIFDYCDIIPLNFTVNNEGICSVFYLTENNFISEIIDVLSPIFLLLSFPGIILAPLFGSVLFLPLFNFLFYLALGGFMGKIINEIYYFIRSKFIE